MTHNTQQDRTTCWRPALAVAGLLAAVAGAAHASVDPQGIVNVAAAVVPDSVSTAVGAAVSPVAEQTSAFIPGTTPQMW